MVCFRYTIVNTPHKSDNTDDDDGNNNNNNNNTRSVTFTLIFWVKIF